MNFKVFTISILSVFLISCGTGEDIFPYEENGLSFSDHSKNKMVFSKAKKRCSEMGGRLPDITEARFLVQNCYETEDDGLCPMEEGCLEYESCYYLSCSGCKYSWTGKYFPYPATEKFLLSGRTWTRSQTKNDFIVFNYSYALIGYEDKNANEKNFVICVKN